MPQPGFLRTTIPGFSSLTGMSRLITGMVASPLDRNPGRTAFDLSLLDIDGTRVSGRVRVNVREELTALGYGDRIRVSGMLSEPRGSNNLGGFDYPAYLAQNGIYFTVNVKNAEKIDILSRGTGIFRTIQDWRERIRQAFLASTTGQGSAIIQAMVLGEEGGLTDEVRDRFMAAGVTHIISISGSHLGMVAVLCFGLIRGLLFLMPERLLPPFDPLHRPEKNCRMAYLAARDFLHAPRRRTGRHGPLARHDSGRAGRAHPGPRTCAHAVPRACGPPHPGNKPAGHLRHLLPAFLSLGFRHRRRC